MTASLRRGRAAAVLLAATATLLAGAGAAHADTITSQNWSGYAAHGSGVKFKRVTATWRQPAAICSSGDYTYSAFWVGIGGYSLSSAAMEQVGSELDCNANGTESMSTWYELVPAPSRTIRMTVASGDLMTGTIAIAGNRVTITIADTTRGERFSKTIVDHTIDATSAEWIAEAPSNCTSSTNCATLPLADFGGIDFSGASAQTAAGATESIASRLWKTTEILLGYKTEHSELVASASSATAVPTSLAQAGHAFRVNYAAAASGTATGTGTGPGAGTGTGTGPGAADPGGPGGTGAPGSGGPGGFTTRSR